MPLGSARKNWQRPVRSTVERENRSLQYVLQYRPPRGEGKCVRNIIGLCYQAHSYIINKYPPGVCFRFEDQEPIQLDLAFQKVAVKSVPCILIFVANNNAPGRLTQPSVPPN